jgi:hypothetical protein
MIGDVNRGISMFKQNGDVGLDCWIWWSEFDGLAYQGKDIVFRLIIEYNSLRDFAPYTICLFL